MLEIIELYEYGNGTYAKPFWERVREKIDKVSEKYEVVDMVKKFIPAHYVGENCMGMPTYKGDELFLTLFCKKKTHNKIAIQKRKEDRLK